LIGQGLQFVIYMGGTAVLARLLYPRSFGLLAMVYTLISLGAMLGDAGLGIATIQRRDLNHEQASALFWIGVGVGSVVSISIALLSPLAAVFFREADIVTIVLAIAPTIFIQALGMQHQALMSRRMQYARLAAVGVTAQTLSTGLAIFLACRRAEHWALVARAVALPTLMTLLFWVVCRWRPGRFRRTAGLRSLIAFGGTLVGVKAFGFLRRNLDNVLIGAVWGADVIGFYSRAYRIILMPIEQVTGPISTIAIPALSRLQGDAARFRRYYVKAVHGLTSISMPLSVLTIAQAHHIVPVLLGDRWQAVVPLLRALAIPAFLGSFNIAQGWVLVPLGHATRQFKCVACSSMFIVAMFFIGLPYGALGVALAFAVGEALMFFPLTMFAFHGSPVRLRDLGEALWRPAAACVCGTASACLADLHAQASSLVALPLNCAAFGLAYVLTAFLLNGGRNPLDFWQNRQTLP
jgi:PST family polysaccharide transporter